jgi:hypothetical protein
MSLPTLLATTAAYVGDRERLQELGSGFRDKKEEFSGIELVYWVALAVAALVALAWFSRWFARHDRRSLFNSPRALFNALCKVHGLDYASRRLLKQLARAFGLPHPARVFVESQCFESGKLPTSLQGQRRAVEKLRQRLFAPPRDEQ